jgi:hypothetical protein
LLGKALHLTVSFLSHQKHTLPNYSQEMPAYDTDNALESETEIEMIRLKTLDLEESSNCKYEIYLQPLILLTLADIVI